MPSRKSRLHSNKIRRKDELKNETTHQKHAVPKGIKDFLLGVIVTVASTYLLAFITDLLHPHYEIGDEIVFGKYEQDNNESNGAELIKWKVIAKQDNQYFLLSENILDSCSYNVVDEDTSWELCSLRKWLNEDFYNSAFSESDKKKIVSVNNTNSSNDQYGTEGGNATLDHVFLLSVDEAEEYLTNDIAYGVCTDYAVERGAYTFEPYTDEDEHTYAVLKYSLPDPEDESRTIDIPFGITRESFWLLRSPGRFQNLATRVFNTSYSKMFSPVGVCIDKDGIAVNADFMGLRPALWYKP